MMREDNVAWKQCPNLQLPGATVFHETYAVTNGHPRAFRNYVESTQEWIYPENDCRHWALGGLQVLGAIHRPWGPQHGLITSPIDRMHAHAGAPAAAAPVTRGLGPGPNDQPRTSKDSASLQDSASLKVCDDGEETDEGSENGDDHADGLLGWICRG